MKELYLVRHAKSDWGHEFLLDIDRPLNHRGYDDAYRMSSAFKEKHKIPDLLITSPATRAIGTAFIFARTFGISEQKLGIEPRIYEASANRLTDIVSDLSDQYQTVMLFGHNPGLTSFINSVSDAEIDNLPTCGIVLLSYETNAWKKIPEQTAHFSFSEFPREFRS